MANAYVSNLRQMISGMSILPRALTMMAHVTIRHYQLQMVHMGGCTMSPRTGSESGMTD
jgi:Cu/Ag efflux protein CusF